MLISYNPSNLARSTVPDKIFAASGRVSAVLAIPTRLPKNVSD